MYALRRSRRIGRLLAAWLLLWFVAMAIAPTPRDVGAAAGLRAASTAGCTGHEVHEDHARHDLQACEPDEGDLHASHDGHGSESLQHCPMCMHAAAPPPPQFVQKLAGEAPAALLAAAPAHVHVIAVMPPPARAPPTPS